MSRQRTPRCSYAGLVAVGFLSFSCGEGLIPGETSLGVFVSCRFSVVIGAHDVGQRLSCCGSLQIRLWSTNNISLIVKIGAWNPRIRAARDLHRAKQPSAPLAGIVPLSVVCFRDTAKSLVGKHPRSLHSPAGSSGARCSTTGFVEATRSPTEKQRRRRSLRKSAPQDRVSISGLRPLSTEVIYREPSETALQMAGLGSGDAGGTDEDSLGDEAKSPPSVPRRAWLSLAMLLLVYISNQWSRSLIYCE